MKKRCDLINSKNTYKGWQLMRILVVVDSEYQMKGVVDVFKSLLGKELEECYQSRDETEMNTVNNNIIFRVKGMHLRGLRAHHVLDLTQNNHDQEYMELIRHIENLPVQ